MEIVLKSTVLGSDALSSVFFSGKSSRRTLYLTPSGQTGIADSLRVGVN